MRHHPNIPPLLSHYLEQFIQVRRAPWKGGWAPQKPVLLLTLLDQMDSRVQSNRFPMDDAFFTAFRRSWRLLVPGDDYATAKILRPLFHMQNDGFWQLVDGQGNAPKDYIGSKSRLKEQIRYGRLEDRLFELLQHSDLRELARLFILNRFFPERQSDFMQQHSSPFFDQLTDYEAEVLLEPPVRYGNRIVEYEGFLRSLAFRRRVLEQYRYTCSISGLRVNMDAPLVEAAHILPHAETGDHSITNGLALCPNLHTAFDYGLISLTDNYRVLVHRDLREEESPYAIRQFRDRRLLLPAEERFRPDPEKLGRHRRRHGF